MAREQATPAELEDKRQRKLRQLREASARFRAAHPERVKAWDRRRRERDPEGVAAYREAWKEANREKLREYSRKWRLANAERQRELVRAWREAHPERVAERYREWAARNPEKLADKWARRSALIRGAQAAEPVDRAAIIARDKSRCHLCGERVPAKQIHLDHIVPVSLGGPHTAANLAVAHARCNLSKGARAANDQLRIVG